MVILDVFAKNINITYKSTLLSKATLLACLFGIVSIALPFIVAYRSTGFWIKKSVFYEQPDVKFKGEYIFFATTNNVSNPIITCSNLPFYERRLNFLDHCSLIKTREHDRNFDGKVDEFDLSLIVNLLKGTHLTSISMILPLDYKLNDVCPLHMQTGIIYQEFLFVPTFNYSLRGDISVTQSGPLECHKRQINTIYNYSIVPYDQNVDHYTAEKIVAEYSQRNLSLVLKNKYVSFVPQTLQNFHFQVHLRYPEDNMYYKSGFWQMMKWAWIQYFALYIIISWLVTSVKSYIFNKRLVLSYEVNPLKKKQ